ncbi:MAG TPA: hypothetical protein PK129_09145, partial [Cellvibrionaceae bacterium]|nr:hypothetical protein [Cellvibrionaceae bacterium]
IANTSLTQNPDGLWVGSVKVAPGTSTLSLAITDKYGGKTTQERAIHNNLYGAYSRAVEYDKDKNRLLLTSWSSDRLMELNLTQNTLQELPIRDRAIKNLLAGTQFLSYLPSSQTLYFPNYLNGSIAKFNLNTSSIERIEGSQGSLLSMLCVHRNTGDVFNTSFNTTAEAGLTLTQFTNQGFKLIPFDAQTLFSEINFGGISCLGNGSIIANGIDRNKLAVFNPASLQITQLDLSTIAPSVTNSQLRIKPFGTGSGYLITLVGNNTAIYKADSIEAKPTLVTGVSPTTGESRGAGAPIFWAWDASIDEDGKRIFARDGNGIISVDIASGDRTQIFAESYTNGDLAGPVGLTLSANRKYAYNFTRWVSSLRRTNLETGEIEVVQFTNRNTPEAYNYSEHHSVAAKFGKNGEAFYQMTANNINIYSPDGELKNRVPKPSSESWGFEVDETTNTAFIIKNINTETSELLAVSLNTGNSTSIQTFNNGKLNIGITRITATQFYLVDSEGTLQELDTSKHTLTTLGSLETAEFSKEQSMVYLFKGRSVSSLDETHHRLYLTYGPNIFALDLSTNQLTPMPYRSGTRLADISGLYFDAKYDMLWATDGVLSSLIAVKNGTNLTVAN